MCWKLRRILRLFVNDLRFFDDGNTGFSSSFSSSQHCVQAASALINRYRSRRTPNQSSFVSIQSTVFYRFYTLAILFYPSTLYTSGCIKVQCMHDRTICAVKKPY